MKIKDFINELEAKIKADDEGAGLKPFDVDGIGDEKGGDSLNPETQKGYSNSKAGKSKQGDEEELETDDEDMEEGKEGDEEDVEGDEEEVEMKRRKKGKGKQDAEDMDQNADSDKISSPDDWEDDDTSANNVSEGYDMNVLKKLAGNK